MTDEERVVLIREIPTDFPCLKDNPCEGATNPADRSESLTHHFDCPTLEAWAVVERILAAREQALRDQIAQRLSDTAGHCSSLAEDARGGGLTAAASEHSAGARAFTEGARIARGGAR